MPFIEPVEGNKFILSSRKIKHWLDLEDSFLVVAQLLNKGFFTRVWPGLSPIPTSLLGFKKSFKSFRAACLGIAASRDWFLMWMALISSKIANLKTVSEDWFSYLIGNDCLQDWLSAVQSSMICNFLLHCLCVGTFLDLQNPVPEQPTVGWFYSWDIPVWYRLGFSNASLQPPPHILQLATTFLLKTPYSPRAQSPSRARSSTRASSPPQAPSPPSLSEYSGQEYQKVQQTYIGTKPWKKFFADRLVKRKKMLEKESQMDHKIRLNRRGSPQLYWRMSGNGNGLHMELLSSFGHAFLKNCVKLLSTVPLINVDMTLCSIAGMSATILDPDDDDDDDYYGGGGNSGNDDMNVDLDVVPDRNAVDAFIDERIGQLINCRFALGTAPSSDQGPEVNLTQESNCIDILKYMSSFYGFVLPLPIPLTDTVLI